MPIEPPRHGRRVRAIPPPPRLTGLADPARAMPVEFFARAIAFLHVPDPPNIRARGTGLRRGRSLKKSRVMNV